MHYKIRGWVFFSQTLDSQKYKKSTALTKIGVALAQHGVGVHKKRHFGHEH